MFLFREKVSRGPEKGPEKKFHPAKRKTKRSSFLQNEK